MPRAGIAAVLCGAFAAVALAAEVKLEAQATEAFVGEGFVFEIKISDFQNCAPPAPPEIPGCEIRGTGIPSDSQYMSIINGQVTRQVFRTYRYELVPSAPGAIRIPPIPVTVDGRTLRTRPLQITVRPSDSADLLLVEISADRSTVFVGQRVPLTLTIFIKPAVFRRQFLEPGEMWRFMTFANFGIFPNENLQVGRQRRATADGGSEMYYAYSVSTEYVPDRVGRLNFDDVEVGMDYPVEIVRDFFDYRARRVRRLRARPEPPQIDVLPVPEEGRPAGYTGAVGRFEIRATATPRAVSVGDPIELSIEIAGDGALKSLPAPDLAANAELARDFRVPREDVPGELTAGAKRFTQVIRPLRDAVREIPPIQYPYFDPQTQTFGIAKTDSIPIEVAPSVALAPEDLQALPDVAVRPETPAAPADGLRENVLDAERVLREAWRPSATAVWAATAGPPAAFGLGWLGIVWSHRRNADPQRKRRRNAAAAARARIRAAGDGRPERAPVEISAAITQFLSDRLAAPPGQYTGAQLMDDLLQRGIPPATAEQVGALRDRCDEAAFAGGAADVRRLQAEAEACLSALERYV